LRRCSAQAGQRRRDVTANSSAGPNGFRKFDFLEEKIIVFQFQRVRVLANAIRSISN